MMMMSKRSIIIQNMILPLINSDHLFLHGYVIVPFPFLPDILQILIEQKEWKESDRLIGELCQKGGSLFEFLKNFVHFHHIEYLISVRGDCPDEEDGIWHDDGSRKMAFSLSLTKHHHLVEGGVLCFRKKQAASFVEIRTPPYGHMIIFQTGQSGHEHRILKVSTTHPRIIVAGWCTDSP